MWYNTWILVISIILSIYYLHICNCDYLYSAFKASGGQGDTYSYNPCYDFTDGECENVAVSYVTVRHIIEKIT